MDFLSLAEALMFIFFGIHTQKYKEGKLKLSEKREKLRQKRLNTTYGENLLFWLSRILIFSGLLILTLTIVEWFLEK